MRSLASPVGINTEFTDQIVTMKAACAVFELVMFSDISEMNIQY